MSFRISGKQAVRLAGCAVFCLFVCVMAFRNRTLILEPVRGFLLDHWSFDDAKRETQENYLSDRLRGKFELLSLNGGFVRLEGRTRYHDVQKMTNGMLTDVNLSGRDTSAFSENLGRFSRSLEARGIPFLFVMAPYKVPLEENLLPAGATDTINAFGDQVLAELAEQKVPFLDLRQEMSRTREQVETYFYRTDHHWNAEGAFRAYQLIMDAIRARFPETRQTFTDAALWEKSVLPDWWLGSHGREVGPLFGGLDDLDVYLPVFETEMTRYSLGVWAMKGDFREVSIREWLLEYQDYFGLDHYQRYIGGGYPVTLHRNSRAENRMSLLLLRDSYALPVECFLSTEIASLDVVDPRMYDTMTEMDYMTLNPPDMVILMVCPGILKGEYYRYYTDFGQARTSEEVSEAAWSELTVSGAEDRDAYGEIPAPLNPGKSYVLTLEEIRVLSGAPEGAAAALYRGDELIDQTIFDIDYGNQASFHWGFQVPENGPDDDGGEEYRLRLYAGISGGTEGVELTYQGLRLREYELRPGTEDETNGQNVGKESGQR